MISTTNAIKSSLTRQVNHWLQAGISLSHLDQLASGNAWQGIEYDLGISLKKTLQLSIQDVIALATGLQKQLETAFDAASLRSVKRGLNLLREKYLRAEETIHFYAAAINSRTTPNIAALLRACDIICVKSMREVLHPLGKETPAVLTYIDKGIGASILKAGLRLWDGQISPFAAIKVTLHNLYRPTSIIHETGHQAAHILNWNDELAFVLQQKLAGYGDSVGGAFAAWASEIAADAFAFVHTGYAAVAALHDVVSGTPAAVFGFQLGDPHPVAYIRVMLNIQMCRRFYGQGPWDDLESSFRDNYDINLVEFPATALIKSCMQAVPEAVDVILVSPYRAFGGQSLSTLVPPEQVSPQALQKLEFVAGPSLFTSHAWIWEKCIQLLALTGYKIGLGQGDLAALYKLQEEWMIKLGFAIQLN
jgi:hypothetical protein